MMGFLQNYGSISNTTQRILSQSNNISYATRGVYRVHVTPEDRKGDYLFRDFYMTLVTAYLTELGFRAVGQGYTVPLMKKYLELDQVPNLDKAMNGRLDDMLRKRVTNSLARDKSNYLIPGLFKNVDMAPLIAKGQLTEAQQQTAEALAEHLQKRMNYGGYLEKLVEKGALTAAEQDTILKAAEAIPKTLASQGVASSQLVKLKERVFDLERQGVASVEEALDDTLKPVFQKLTDATEQAVKGHPDRVQKMIREALHCQQLLNVLKRVQKTSGWPKMGASILLSLIFYGGLANVVDVKFLQPWQEKIYKERGTTQELVKPAYISLIPGLAALAGTSVLTRKLGYVSRFAVAGGLALGAYTVSTVALVKQRLGNTKPTSTSPPSFSATPQSQRAGRSMMTSALRHDNVFSSFERTIKAQPSSAKR